MDSANRDLGEETGQPAAKEGEWVVDLATGRIVRRQRAAMTVLLERSERIRRWYRYGPGTHRRDE